jgi:cytochrome c oxidase subunit IV
MKTHPISVSHLVFGVVFLGIAGVWALRQADVIDSGELQWTLPLILLIAGGAGLVASVAKTFTNQRPPIDSGYEAYGTEAGSAGESEDAE